MSKKTNLVIADLMSAIFLGQALIFSDGSSYGYASELIVSGMVQKDVASAHAAPDATSVFLCT